MVRATLWTICSKTHLVTLNANNESMIACIQLSKKWLMPSCLRAE
jgi:hypothetical protein